MAVAGGVEGGGGVASGVFGSAEPRPEVPSDGPSPGLPTGLPRMVSKRGDAIGQPGAPGPDDNPFRSAKPRTLGGADDGGVCARPILSSLALPEPALPPTPGETAPNILLIGSISSDSGEGKASGATCTPAPAHRIVAAAVWNSIDDAGCGSSSGEPSSEEGGRVGSECAEVNAGRVTFRELAIGGGGAGGVGESMVT